MKKLILIVALLGLTLSCSLTRKVVQVEHRVETHYVDSTRWHDSTIYTTLPVERYRDYASMLDTLKLETSLAAATAYLDTTNKTINGSIENKKDPIKTVIKWKERVVYKDSLVTKEVPVEVTKEVTKYPKSYWWFLGLSLLAIAYVAVKIYLKVRFNKSI